MKLTRRHALFGLLAATPLAVVRSDASTVSRAGTAFGTTVRLTVTAETNARANAAIDSGFTEIRAIGKTFNLFDPASELSRLNANGELRRPSIMMIDLLKRAEAMWQKSEGCFDPTVQPLWTLWSRGHNPARHDIDAARMHLGWQHVMIENASIHFTKPGMALTMNGIAQGYAADCVATVMKDQGVILAIIDTGEIGITTPVDKKHFTIRHPRKPDASIAYLDIAQGFVATSSDYATSFTPDYAAHHIFDPATGTSPQELSSVTVVAPSGSEADAWATAMMVMGHDSSLQKARQYGLRVVLVSKSGDVTYSAS